MSYPHDTLLSFSVQSPKSKIRIGIPPVPRAHGGIIFLRLAKSHKKALRELGWKFYVIHAESMAVDENGDAVKS
jgi:hypothetical protein